jgi:O-antigen/teichoic acid export membrane protein
VATLGLGAAGMLGIGVLGPWALRLVYGPEFSIAVGPMVVVAASGGLFMVAQVVAQALLAHHADGAVAVGWLLGLVGCAASLAAPLDLVMRVSVALCVGALVALLVHAGTLRVVVARWRQAAPHLAHGRPA